MMRMDNQQGGIAALQPTPQQQLGSMVGAPSARLGAPKSPQQAAAEQIVESEVPRELEALLKERKALELLASAQRDKQAQQPVQPQTVKSQVEGGIASMMDRLRPGMAQRGRQVQVARNRQMMGLPAAGMPRMADGGPVQEEAGMLDKIKAGIGELFGGGEEQQPAPFDVEARVIELIKARETADEEAKARIDQALSTFDPDTRAKARQRMSGMQAGGVVGFQDRGFVDVDEIAEEYNLTPEGVDRLLNLDELSEEPQEVEVEAPRERPRYRTPEERRAGPQLGDSLVEFVKENPLQAASLASMAIPGALALRGLGSLGVAGARRFGPGMLEGAKRVLAPLVSKPKMSGYGSTIRNTKTGRMMSAKDAQAAGYRLNRQASIPRIAGTAGVTGLLADQAMRGGGDEVSAEEVAVAPAPREPTPQEKLGSMVGRPTAMFKAGEARQPEERGLMSRVGSALTSDRARAIADALGKLSYAGGATEGYMGQRLQEGLRAERLAEQKRQDELNALEEMRKLEREKIDAQLEAAGVRATATQTAAIQKMIGEYLNNPVGYRADLANFVGKDISELTPEDEATYGNRVIQNYISRVSGQTSQAMAQLPEGVTVTRKDS